MSIKLLIPLFGIFQFSNCLNAQNYVNKDWDTINGHPGQHDNVSSAINPNGNLVYLTNHKPGNNSDNFLNCIHSSGNVMWQQYCASSPLIDDYGVDLKIDNSGNIYVCAAKHNGNNYDFLIAKYDQNGILIWQKIYNSTFNNDDVPSAIEIDASNNVFVTGTSLANGTNTDYLTLKLNGNNGTIDWTKRYDFNHKPEVATDIVINSVGDVFVCGSSAQSAVNSDFLVIKYSGNNGDQLAFHRQSTSGNGYDIPSEMKIASNNDIFIVGTSNTNQSNPDIEIVAYNSDLQLKWIEYIDKEGNEDEGSGLAIDNVGNVIVTGTCSKLNGGKNLIISKYNAIDGAEIWKRERSSMIDTDVSKGNKVTTDMAGNIYICGEEDRNGSRDILTMAFAVNGNMIWSRLFNNASNGMEAGRQIVVKDNNVYVTGKSIINGQPNIVSVKYSTRENPMNIVYVDGEPSYVDNNIIVRFDRSKLNLSTIDKKDIEASVLIDFVDVNFINEMSAKTGIDCLKLKTFKIHKRATTADSLSITRLGDTIKVTDFWASLVIEIPQGIDEQTVCDSLSTLVSGIHYTHLNPIFIPFTQDPLYGYQRSLWDGFPSQIVKDIRAENAWQIESGQSNVKVGVIDNVIDWSHPDFHVIPGDNSQTGSKIADGYDYISGSDLSQANYVTTNHGTSVAGIIGAIKDNNIGIAGIAGGNMLLGNSGVPLYSLGISYDNNFTTWNVIGEAILEGSLQTTNYYGFGLHVENHSWGTTVGNIPDIRLTVEECWRNHCVTVAARGHYYSSGNEAVWPACLEDQRVLNVMANGIDGHRKNGTSNGEGSWSSMYGLTGANNTIRCDVDFMAPGYAEHVTTLKSTFASPYPYTSCLVNDPLYGCFDGTSASAPHVSGTVGLMLSHHNVANGYINNLSTEDVEHILQKTASFATTPGYTLTDGYGVIDAHESVMMIHDPYYVKHSTNTAPTVTDLGLINNGNVVYCPSSDYVPSGYYVEARKYKVDWNMVETLPTGHTIIDSWELEASQRMGTHGNNTSIIAGQLMFTAENLNAPIGSNVATATATTYVYKLKKVLNGTTTYHWYPTTIPNLNYAFSLHVQKPLMGIDENGLTNVSLYPNPSSDRITVSFEMIDKSDIEILITDATGRIILTQDVKNGIGENQVEININNLQQGVYYCSVKGNGTILTLPFIKTN
jgi:hypothetical protein